VTSNYPAALTFFQGRLWFGGTPTENSKFWGSKSGVYEDFTTGTAADDSVVYQIAKRGTIRWMTGLKSLLIGTDNAEYVITSEAGVITPTDIKIEPQSSFGSAAVQPYQVGNQVLYVSPDRLKLRTMGYRFEEQGWITQDLTFAAEHITAGRIQEIAYCQNPESVIWMVDQSGNLIACTYDRSNNIIGWHRHTSPEIFWFSCCSGRYFGIDWLWVAGVIQLTSGPELVVCNMQRPTSPGPWMDAAVTVVGTALAVTFSGFAHLEGKTVSVIADGAIQPDVVVAGGTITIQEPALEVTAGLPFTSKVVTNPIEVGQNPKGSEQMKKHNNRVYLRFNLSKYPIINGVRPPTRFPQTPMNTSDPAFTGDVFATSLGWNRIEQVTIEENIPIPLTLLGIFLETAAEMPE
jgi:hypothetical protein